MERAIIWNKRPANFLSKALKRISEDSLVNAEIVESAILTALNGIKLHPEKFPPDKFKSNNSGDFRAFETHSFRVSYRFNTKEIRVLRIRHIKQEPRNY